MTPENFIYWLNGFIELTGEIPNREQWNSIREHLSLVMTKVTTPTQYLHPIWPNSVPKDTTIIC